MKDKKSICLLVLKLSILGLKKDLKFILVIFIAFKPVFRNLTLLGQSRSRK